MGNRRVPLVTGEYYHIYSRGVEKRTIVLDDADIERFLLSLKVFNSTDSVGSIYEYSLRDSDLLGSETSKLVDVIAYNVLPNHYHLLLRQRVDRGISKYMQSHNGGYTKYFNHKYDRVGPLFQGVFGSTHIKDDSQLRYVSAYVNLNHAVHFRELGSETSKWGEKSSWEQYSSRVDGRKHAVVCKVDLILSSYANREEYKKEAEEIAEMIAEERQRENVEENEVLHRHLGV